jgi:hypothetical protein
MMAAAAVAVAVDGWWSPLASPLYM